MRRAASWAVALVLALFAAAVPLAATSGPSDPVEHNAECPADYPTLLPTGSRQGSVYSQVLAGLVVCSDPLGTATLIRNWTDAVWVLEEPSRQAVLRAAGSPLRDSFLSLVASPGAVIPSGDAILVPRPPSAVRVSIDPELTVAQLAHDQLAGSLALGTRSAALLERYEDAAAGCLRSLVERVGPAEIVLRSGNPSPAITEAAERLAADDRVCVALWADARGGSLAGDVAAWHEDGDFAFRGMRAAVAYLALIRPSLLAP